MKTLQKKLIDDVSLTEASVASQVMDIRHIYCFSCQYVVAGSAFGGTLTFQGSNDIVDLENSQTPTNWSTIGSAVTISAAATTMINFDGQGFAYFRAIFATGGTPTGTLSVVFNGKGA